MLLRIFFRLPPIHPLSFHYQGDRFTVVNRMIFLPLREQAGTGIAQSMNLTKT